MKSQSSKLTEEEVRHIAKLANLTLTEEEVKKFQKQLSDTLAYIEVLNELKTDSVKPSPQVTGLENVSREDKTRPSLSQKEALLSSVSTYKGYFKTKGVLEK